MSVRSRTMEFLKGWAVKEPAAPTEESDDASGVATLRDGKYTYSFVCHSRKERNRAQRMFEKEKGTIAWLDRELRSDDIFFDIGANIGVYTIFGARRISAPGAVVAFEPHIPNANSLIENIMLNGVQDRVRLVTSALSNKNHFNRFNYQSMMAASSTSQFGGSSYEGESFDPVFYEFKHGCTLDSLCEGGVVPAPNVIKIDVDGLDFEVLEGMRGLLTSSNAPRCIQVELGSDSKSKILQLCDETGYILKEKHWSAAGLDFINKGNDPENYPHYGIFHRSR